MIVTTTRLARAASIAALLALCGTPAQADEAGPLRDAQRSLNAGDYGEAFARYRYFAEEENNHLAQFTLALFYQLGWGRPVDRPAACAWHEKAAAGGIPAATHFLAVCLDEGIGRPADPAGAAQWYRRAADLGHSMSLCSLAELYIEGRGVPRDPARGFALCAEAANKGVVPAQIRMGELRLEGDGNTRDYDAARRWFEMAAGAGAPEASYYLGVMSRDGLGRAASPMDARQWFEHAAGLGYLPAYLPTAALYFEAPRDPQTGRLPALDLAKAYLWLRASVLRMSDPAERARAQGMLARVVKEMPASWTPDLDAKVAAHVARFAPP